MAARTVSLISFKISKLNNNSKSTFPIEKERCISIKNDDSGAPGGFPE